MRSFHRILAGCIVSISVFSLWISPPVRNHIHVQPGYFMQVGQVDDWGIHCPEWIRQSLSLQIEGEAQSVFGNDIQGAVAIDEENPLRMQAVHAGQSRVSLMLWETIPLKVMEVESVEPRHLVPGGHSIGVMLQSNGVMVVGFAPITDSHGEKSCPAGEQGLKIGDRVMKANGQAVHNEEELLAILDKSQGKAVQFEIEREKERLMIAVQPVYCPESGRFRIGLYVRDQAVGIGTLSFWDPKSHAYAALGHVILDADTHQAIEVGNGHIVSAPVSFVSPGRPGVPGEKTGSFSDAGSIDGNILKNCLFGIYGVTKHELDNELSGGTVEAGSGRQVHLGKAEIFTVVKDERIERFEVEIARIYPSRTNGKNMLLKITDERLLRLTGGIIQGMSGSPILQDGKLIGAVTHVLLNDPTRGYGVFIDQILENMPVLDE